MDNSTELQSEHRRRISNKGNQYAILTTDDFRLLTTSAFIVSTCSSLRADDAALESTLNRIQTLEEQVSRLNREANANSISNPYGITQCVCQSDGHSVGSCGANCVVNGGDADSTAVPLTVVYDNGFVLKPVDINKTPFSMTINVWFQARHSYFDSDGPTPDQNDFEFERKRLAFRGIARPT